MRQNAGKLGMIGLLQLCRAADGQSVARRAVIEQRAAAGKLSLVVRARPRELVLICLRPGQIDRVQRSRLSARQLPQHRIGRPGCRLDDDLIGPVRARIDAASLCGVLRRALQL